MPKVSSSHGYAQPDDVDQRGAGAYDEGDFDAPREQSFSHEQGAQLEALGSRRMRSSSSDVGGSAPRGTALPPSAATGLHSLGDAPAAAGTVRRRRAAGERRHRPGEASMSGSQENRDAPDAEQPGVAQFARRAGRAAVTGMVRAAQVYVGLAAVSTVYRAARNPRDIIERPLGMISGGWSFSERVDEHTVAQGRAEVLEAHGGFIPPDSACYGVTPSIVDDWSLGDAGSVNRGNHRSGDWRPTDFRLNRFATNAGGRHAVHHEYLHCFTHPAFASAISRSPHAATIEEALTEYFADRLPGHAVGKLSSYDFSRLSNGKRWSAAAAELEQAVGSDTLQRAYFSGDADAVRAVSAATISIWPKDVTNTAWRSIRSHSPREQQALAECFVGAALLATGAVPAEPRPGSGNDGNWPMSYLPVMEFNQISPAQAEALRTQAETVRSYLGPEFDQAFYGFNQEMQGEAMAHIRGAIHAAWRPVL